MDDQLIERLQQWPSCPAGADPFAATYVGDLMKKAAAEIEGWKRVAVMTAVPLEALRLSGHCERMTPGLARDIETAVFCVRLAMGNGWLPPAVTYDESAARIREEIASVDAALAHPVGDS